MSLAELIAALQLLAEKGHREKTVLIRAFNREGHTDVATVYSVDLNKDKSVVIVELDY